jgi:hypothetical protein
VPLGPVPLDLWERSPDRDNSADAASLDLWERSPLSLSKGRDWLRTPAWILAAWPAKAGAAP